MPWGNNYSSDSLQLPGRGTPPFGRGSPAPSLNTTHSSSSLPPDPVDRNPPDIDLVSWFSFLDRKARSSNDNLSYAQFGPLLRVKGFLRISQLTPDFVTLSELQDWLGVG
ncbi:hypothetical protein OG21DRAFT_1490111 [Imleria badia]|nr:hypothetical protein OG21DRAFT_1490111 [Imleria badia]